MLIAERYQMGKEIGKGGMGIVYQGEDVADKTPVAIKSLKPDVIAMDPQQVERFIQEGEVLRQLNHPNIVKMLAASQYEACYYLVMEYVEGGSLLDVLHETPRLSIQRTLYIALDLADALTRAHRLDVLHRDIKPANVLIAADGTPRLTDFGMARVGDSNGNTQEGAIVGTLSYLAPEVFQGEQPDERSDIWAFGIMLYEMLAGHRPFGDGAPGQLINAILTQPIPPLEDHRPDIPTALVDLIGRMLERDRHARIPSVRLVGAELEAIIRGATTSMQYVVAPDSTGRFESSNFTPTPTVTEGEIIPPHNLPAQPTQFVGRDSELEEIKRLLQTPSERLITLLGPGGIGKSRLVLAAAEQQIGEFSDGIFFVPLAPIEDSEFLVPTIGDHIDLTFSGMGDPRQELICYLEEKQMLLILDNFEHLMAGAGIISEIIREAPHVKILVTSRERLRLRGEQIFEVEGMRLPDENDPEIQLCDFPSVRLFTQSAHRVAPDFDINLETGSHVVEIIKLVQGLPLGIELAAAWLEALSVEEIVSEIENSLDFLETDLRDVPERHRSVRAVFDYSWNLMTEDERDVFTRLSIFRGGFEREAAQKIAGASLRTLTNLVNKSLLQREPSGRYRMHKLLRQYAEAAFEVNPERDAVYAAHSKYYGDVLNRLEAAFNSRKEQSAIEQIEVELENLRLALNWATKNQMWEAVGQVKHTILLFYLGRSMFREGVETFHTIADMLVAAGLGDSELYWSARMREAVLQSRMGDYERVWELAGGAHAAFVKSGNRLEEARALNLMSYTRMMIGEFEPSIQYAKEASEIATELNVIPEWWQGMGNWGYAEYLRGNHVEARRIYEKLTTEQVDLQYSPTGKAYGLNNLGEIVREMGELQRAQTLFQEAYDTFAANKMQRGMAFTLNNLGGIMQATGDYESAQRYYEQAYRINRKIGDQWGIGHSLSALGNLAAFAGDNEKAEDYFKQSLDVRRRLGEQRGIADSLTDLSRNAVVQGNIDTAEQYIAEADEIYTRIGDRQGSGYVMGVRGMIVVLRGKFDEARHYLSEASKVGEEIQSRFLSVQSQGGMAMIALKEHDYAAAREYGRKVLRVALEAKVTPMVLVSIAALAMVKAGEGHPQEALELLALTRNQHGIFIEFLHDDLDQLYEELIAELPDDTTTIILEQGKQLDPYEVGYKLLQSV